MPRVSTELNSQYWEPGAQGPVAQADLTAYVAAPATIAANGSWTSGILNADGFKDIAVGATLSTAGSITVARYLDAAGIVPQTSPAGATAALTANAAGIANVMDGVPFQSFSITIANAAASVATLSKFCLLLNAA